MVDQLKEIARKETREQLSQTRILSDFPDSCKKGVIKGVGVGHWFNHKKLLGREDPKTRPEVQRGR